MCVCTSTVGNASTLHYITQYTLDLQCLSAVFARTVSAFVCPNQPFIYLQVSTCICVCVCVCLSVMSQSFVCTCTCTMDDVICTGLEENQIRKCYSAELIYESEVSLLSEQDQKWEDTIGRIDPQGHIPK